MPGFAPKDDPAPNAPRFRLVDTSPGDSATAPETDTAGDARGAIASMIADKLLVGPAEWHERRGNGGAERVTVRIQVPLIASLARIRSEADAALALTGVLELVARRFHVALPCAIQGEDAFAFEAHLGLPLAALTGAIDDALLGVVRATDLQGALREKVLARAEVIDAADVA